MAAGYAFGFDAAKSGSTFAAGLGATEDHCTDTRITRAPSARTSGSAVTGDCKNDPSWMIDSCAVDADAGAGESDSTNVTASRAAIRSTSCACSFFVAVRARAATRASSPSSLS